MAKESIGCSLGGLDLVTVVFVILKLTGEVDWAWKWVLAPTWIPLALIIGIWIIAIILMAIFD
jgi:hypothetical protein